MRSVSSLLLFALLYGCVSVTQEEAELEVRDMWERFEKAYDAGDAEGVSALYAEDANRINPQGVVAHGRTEIQAQYAAAIASRQADPSTLPYHADITVRLLRPDIAIIDGTTVRNSEETYQFTVIASKTDGQWLIAAGRPRGLLVR